MPTEVLLVSPNKANQTIVVPSPQMNDVRLVMLAVQNPDHSWDVGKLERTSDGYIATRPRPEDRPEARRAILGDYMHNAAQDRDRLAGIFRQELRNTVNDLRNEHRQDIARLEQEIAKNTADLTQTRADSIQNRADSIQNRADSIQNRADLIRAQRTILSVQDHLIRQTQSAVLFNDITESYEVVSRVLRGLNDIIFDVDRQPQYPADVVLTAVEKEGLKMHGLGYLAQLLHPPETLTQDIADLRLRALTILSPPQQHLARVLLEIQEFDGQRNLLHHPRPDRITAMDRMRRLLDDDDEALQTLQDLLDADPKRLLSRREQINATNADLYLFEQDGLYSNVASQKEDLQNLRAERADTEAYLEALESE
ncbi:hypothetical protein FB451DRAFT_1225988 [Mycena latifolia]|nr:hypothetical protein FB451DRAFT_1225988 [Mycena latifolia]